MRTLLSALLVAALTAGVVAGCEERTDEETICFDLVDHLAAAYEACGYDYTSARASVLEQLDDCEGVRAIRDRDALYDECFPELALAACVDLENGTFPAACQQQIAY